MNARFFCTILGLLSTVNVAAQEPKKIIPPPVIADVRLDDGSLIRMTILQAYLEVETKYGKLVIPVSDIRRIDFGLRVSPAVAKNISEAIRLLGSKTHKERETATKLLISTGYRAYPMLKRAPSHDLEVKLRVEEILKRINGREPPELLRLKNEDVVHATAFPVVGRIVGDHIKVHAVLFGEVTLKLSDVRTLYIRTAVGENEFAVDAAKHGSAADQWFDTGIIVEPSQRITITGSGQIDLWPQGPGQYTTTPKGYTTMGQGGTYRAGILLGKIGDTGKVFVIGERYEGVPTTEGALHLHIVPSPWNNASIGTYNVRIQTQHALSPR